MPLAVAAFAWVAPSAALPPLLPSWLLLCLPLLLLLW
jgi:hypothetical protein